MNLEIRGVSKTYPNGVQALRDLEDVYFSTMAGNIGRRQRLAVAS
jgi:hypothetical protein